MMSKKGHKSRAQISDKLTQMTWLAVFCISLAIAASAATFAVTEEIAGYLNILKIGLSILGILVVLPALVQFIKLTIRKRGKFYEPEGYVKYVYERAAGKSFSFTLIFLVVMAFVTRKNFIGLPTEFFILAIYSVSLAFFSLTFLYLSQTGKSDEGEDNFEGDQE